MVMQPLEVESRVNVLLPHPLFEGGLAADLTGGGAEGTWAPQSYRAARDAVYRLESSELARGESDQSDPELIARVLDALTRGSGRRGMSTASRTSRASENGAPDSGPVISIADLDRVGPPEGATIVIEDIGVISTVAPTVGAEGVEIVAHNLQDVAPGIRVEPAGIMRAVSGLLTETPQGIESLGYPLDALLETDEGEEWFEALLESGAAAETLPWGVDRVNARRAWAQGFFGQGIRVAIVDTGVGPHVDLPAPVASATFVPGTTSANDDNGHGTHVAGTALARQNGIGVVGVAPRAQLMRAKVLSRTGSGTDAGVAAGITWAVNNGARIINLSLGGGFSAAIQRALIYARSRRVAVCAAAGNDYCRPVGYPGRDPLVMGVAATDRANRRAPFSSCGREIDLSAPGADILSTYLSNGYRALNGTSMATPHVAGVAALVLSKRPGLNPVQLQQLLERTAIPLGPVNHFGRGLVQADRAVAIAEVDGSGNGAFEMPAAESGELVAARAASTGGQRRRG